MTDPLRPITAVILDLGYSDPGHFTCAFSRWTGRAPRLAPHGDEAAG